MTLKEKLYRHCIELVNEKIRSLQHTLLDLRESAANETKSTAGDKHETALAMLQIEQENTNRQLKDALEQKIQLNKIDIHASAPQIINGSLVKTDKGYLFLSTALGKINIHEISFIALSPQSPLGAKLLGHTAHDITEMNGINYFIQTIE